MTNKQLVKTVYPTAFCATDRKERDRWSVLNKLHEAGAQADLNQRFLARQLPTPKAAWAEAVRVLRAEGKLSG